MSILSYSGGVLEICLDDVLRDDTDISSAYAVHNRFGFSYEPYGQDLAKKINLEGFLVNNVTAPERLLGVCIKINIVDVGVSTSFLRGLLKPVSDFSDLNSWVSNFQVVVQGRYKETSALAASAFIQGEISTGEDYVELIGNLKQGRSSEIEIQQ